MLATAMDSERPMTDARAWYALSVMSRQEFTTSQELQRKGVEVFLPAIKRIRQWSDRRKLVEFPLFPGYMFVRLKQRSGEFVNAVSTRGAVRFVSFEQGTPAPVQDDEIESLRSLLACGRPVEVFSGLHVGDKVRIRRGPLAGTYGTVSRLNNTDMFIVNIDILGRSVATSMSVGELEAA